MPKRIFLVHPTPLSMPPIDDAFKTLWAEAETLNLLDKSLYADIPPDGTLAPANANTSVRCCGTARRAAPTAFCSRARRSGRQ